MAVTEVELKDTFLNFMNKTNQAIKTVNLQISDEQIAKLKTDDKTSLVAAINEILKNSINIKGGTIEGNMTTTGYLSSNTFIRVGSNNNGDSIIYLYDDNRNVYKALKWNNEKDELTIEDNFGNHNKILHENMTIDCNNMNIELQQKSILKNINDASVFKKGQIVYLSDSKQLAYHDGETQGGYTVPTLKDIEELGQVKISSNDKSNGYLNEKIQPGKGIYTNKEVVSNGEILRINSGLSAGLVNFWPGPTNKLPLGWIVCDGRALDRTKYKDLFSVIGSTYGSGNGYSTFNIPNYSGRFLFGVDSSATLASVGGEKTHKLTIQEMPSHNHQMNMSVYGMDHKNRDTWQAKDGDQVRYTQNAGGNQPHNNMPPYSAGYWIIFTNVFES